MNPLFCLLLAIISGVFFGAATMFSGIDRAIDIAIAVVMTLLNVCMTIDLKD